MAKKVAVLVPVYNEEAILQKNIDTLFLFLKNSLKEEFVLVILDSYSTDKTQEMAIDIADRNPNIKYMNLKSPGKGGKIKHFVLNSDYDYYAFIDADLPIGLDRFQAIIDSVINKGADLAIASRYIGGGKSHRRMNRNIASKIYNLILNIFRIIPTHDAFAGAKCWNVKVKESVWPKINNLEWFFDTELIYYSVKNKFVVREIPVIYNDLRKDSKLNAFRDGIKIGKSLLKFVLTKEK